jgi:uracil-DNA glycosylase
MNLISEVQYIPTQWKEIILDFIKNNTNQWNAIEDLYKIENTKYEGEIEIYPKRENIFRCFHYFDPKDTEVVLMGQDPYHGHGQATGLCFGVPEGEKIPPSLRNIKKEMLADIGKDLDDPDRNISLEHWAKQGVLMLNASLTVREGSAGSHMKYWLPLTRHIIQYLKENNKQCLFIAWGAFAHKQLVDANVDEEKNIISSHPSPLSASKSYKHYSPFLGSKPFSKINGLLEKPIDW